MERSGIRQLFILASLLPGAALAVADRSIVQRGQCRGPPRAGASCILADELRRSPDDLTRLARTSVVAGDPKWEQQHLEELDIRNGKKAGGTRTTAACAARRDGR